MVRDQVEAWKVQDGVLTVFPWTKFGRGVNTNQVGPAAHFGANLRHEHP